MNFFTDKKYVINLDFRPDRKAEFRKMMNFHHIGEYEYFKAIEHVDPVQGCRLSHLELIEKASNENQPHVIILEDDTLLIPDFNDLVQESIDSLPKDWDMFYFGCNNKRSPKMVNDKIGRCVDTFALSAYAVNRKSYGAITYELKTRSIPADEIFVNHIHPGINAYCAVPVLCYQRPGYSDIEKQNVDYKFYYDNPIKEQ